MPEALAGTRLDKAMAQLLPGLSRTLSRKVIKMGGVYIGEERCRVASRPVRPGDILTATWHPDVLVPPEFQLDVVYEDEQLVIVDKPSGQHVQGTELGDVGTLVRALQRRFGPATRLVHRIDAPASGLLVAGRDAETVTALSALFRVHDIGRSYLAAVAGSPAGGARTVPLVRAGRRMRLARPGDEGALEARTDIKVLARHPTRALVEARLHTGRTHQVRVHLAGTGTPIVGDRLYGGPAAERLCLHARSLAFAHPVDGRALAFERPPAEGFWASAGIPAPPELLASVSTD